MAKRPTKNETINLAIELLKRIPRSRKISSSELHKQLNEAGLKRDLRTIQRQLEALSESFDIERDERNKPYGYRWKEKAEGFSLPGLNQKESLLLALAEQYLKSLLPSNLMKSMEGFFSQARTNFGPHNKSSKEREWLDKVRIVSSTQPLLPPKIKEGVFDEVSDALYGNLWLQLDYENASGNSSQIKVMPLGLAQQGPRLYLVCRYEGYENERSLALHRIQSARAMTLLFERPKEFDLEKYDDDGRFGFGEGDIIKLNFSITKTAGSHLYETPLSLDQEIDEVDDILVVTATVVDTAQLDWWLRGFGKDINNISKTNAAH